MNGLDAADLETLRRLENSAGADAHTDPAADALWRKTRGLIDAVGVSLFGSDGFDAALWPDSDDAELPPFLWARLKQRGQEKFATHIGIFISPGFCNLSLDLEKDLIDAGTAAETLDQVIAFYRDACGALIAVPGRPDLMAWMDTKNVVAAAEFGDRDFDEFLADNRDAGHPWPKVGYLLRADDVLAFADHFVEQYAARATQLVPLYDAALRSFEGA